MRFERQILLLRDQELFFSLEKVFESKTQEWESHYLALNSMSWRKNRVPREIEWKKGLGDSDFVNISFWKRKIRFELFWWQNYFKKLDLILDDPKLLFQSILCSLN